MFSAAVTARPRPRPHELQRGARSRLRRIDPWHVAPVVAAIVFAAVYLIWEPRTVDLAAHTFRAELFAEEGFTIWNGQWYGGHHTPAYSIISPPLAWLLGPPLALAIAAVASAALFPPLARGAFGEEREIDALRQLLQCRSTGLRLAATLGARQRCALGDDRDPVEEVSHAVAVGIGLERRQPIEGDERRPEDHEQDAARPEEERHGRREPAEHRHRV